MVGSGEHIPRCCNCFRNRNIIPRVYIVYKLEIYCIIANEGTLPVEEKMAPRLEIVRIAPIKDNLDTFPHGEIECLFQLKRQYWKGVGGILTGIFSSLLGIITVIVYMLVNYQGMSNAVYISTSLVIIVMFTGFVMQLFLLVSIYSDRKEYGIFNK